MKRLFSILLAAAVGLFFVGCYNDLDNPGAAKIYTDADFADMEYWSIKDIKDKFIAANPSYTSNNGGVYKMVVQENAYTRGKVISSDDTGNVYKTIYIYDEQTQRAIEVKLNTDNYLFFPIGSMVYVTLKGLVLGNYRGMISIGTYSDDAKYANGNILLPLLIEEHVHPGVKIGMTPADTLVVNSTNYNTLSDNDLGRLVRFEDITSAYGKTKWGYKNRFPNYFANSTSYDEDTNPDWEIWKKPTWSLKRQISNPDQGFSEVFYFGSTLVTYTGINSTSVEGNYVIRTSGYARFREQPIPADGEKVTVTALYTKFTGPAGQNPAYQLVINSASDVVKSN
ncbi:DUF5689 domain-containing protein [Alistipes sp.]|uniref:DUF5689 domain-containing protein n=1 Tax=Alistipes sp. TaxID=1872444 RepID=UPI003AEF72E0